MKFYLFYGSMLDDNHFYTRSHLHSFSHTNTSLFIALFSCNPQWQTYDHQSVAHNLSLPKVLYLPYIKPSIGSFKSFPIFFSTTWKQPQFTMSSRQHNLSQSKPTSVGLLSPPFMHTSYSINILTTVINYIFYDFERVLIIINQVLYSCHTFGSQKES